jgi:N6-L-threonylcarbamoyladenine synthase
VHRGPCCGIEPALSVFVFGDQDGSAALCGGEQAPRASCEARQRALSAMAQPAWQDAQALCDRQTLDLIASFQHAVIGDLLRKTFAAAEAVGAASVLVTGGVAANRELRVRFTAEAAERGLPVAFPTPALSTDNAAMIAAAAWPRFLAGEFAGWNLEANPRLTLG